MVEGGCYGAGMWKLSIDLPDELKASLERKALEEGRSEAEIVRRAIRRAVANRPRQRPILPLFPGGFGDSGFAERSIESLDGFGE